MKPGQKLHFAEGQLFTTFNDRPEFVLFFVDDEARKLVDSLRPVVLAYITDPARGEFRGFAAWHDLCDANMMLPGAKNQPFREESAQGEYVDFCNAVMAEFNRLILCAS